MSFERYKEMTVKQLANNVVLLMSEKEHMTPEVLDRARYSFTFETKKNLMKIIKELIE